MCHQPNHGDDDHRLTAIDSLFVIFAEPTIPTQPGKSPFDYPTLGQDFKSLGLFTPPDNLEHNLAAIAEDRQPLNQRPRIRPVRPNQTQPIPSVGQVGQHSLFPITVLFVCCMDDTADDESQRVDQQMPLSSDPLLAGVITPDPPFSVVLTV